MDMNKIVEGEAIWAPNVLGRMRLDERRFMYHVRAPFDMAADIPNLIDTMVVLDDAPFVIRGISSKVPAAAITKQEVIALLVRAL
jgi:hypothetical protein